jgi:hypothetical protein
VAVIRIVARTRLLDIIGGARNGDDARKVVAGI